MPSFSANIAAFVKKTGVSGTLVVKKLAFDGLRGVIMKSPVDTGRFRANWRVGLNTPDLTVTSAPKSAPKQGTPPDATSANTAMAGVKWGSSVWLTNNLPYGPALEEGHSKQAPNGMLGLTFAELKANLNKVVQQVKNR